MSTPFDLKTRFPVPRWVRTNIMAGTIFGKVDTAKVFHSNVASELERLASIWEETHSEHIAAEVVNLAYHRNIRTDIVRDAAERVSTANSLLIGSGVREKATSILSNIEPDSGLDETQRFVNSSRRKLEINPEDPFAHLDLAFHFTTLQDLERARKHIAISARFGEGNLFISRAISRFLLHADDDIMGAVTFIRNFARANPSPGAFASEIAISLCADASPRSLNVANKLLKASPRPGWDISELSSIFAWFELRDGNKKTAKKMASLSLASPNENSLAQILSIFTIDDPGRQFFQPSHDYESQALAAYWKANYDSAVDYGQKWVLFQPFSTKPLSFLAHIYASVFFDYKKALELCNRGRIISSNDFTINNDIVYYSLKLGVGLRSLEPIETLKRLCRNSNQEAVLTATQGLYQIRLGNYESGKNLYQSAIAHFNKVGLTHMKIRAELNLIEEQISFDPKTAYIQLDRLAKENKFSDDLYVRGVLDRLRSKIHKAFIEPGNSV